MTNKRKKFFLIAGIILIVIIFISIYLIYVRNVNEKRKESVKEFKKEIYYSILCQYSCPLSLQNIRNKTQMLPSIECIKNCSTNLNQKYSKNDFKKEEIEDDDLLKDIDDSIKPCKTESMNLSIMKLDNLKYFNCAKNNLEKLKEKYIYLN
ncbi:MAG: hypothetical protein QXW97_03380 [Candidatus Pacearchaeota archaeon]